MLVDGDNLLYRAFYKFGGLTSKDGTPSGCLFGFPYILRSLLTKVKPDQVICVFDGGRDKSRMEKLPGYKEREKKLGFDAQAFYNQKKWVMDLLPNLSCWVVWHEGMEADDLIHKVTRRYVKKDWEVVIISGDKDFHQLITDTVSVYQPNKEIFLTPKNLKHYTGYSPEECVDYLCLIGDKSDKIPGARGIGEKRARQFLDKYGSIRAYLNSGNKDYPQVTKDVYNLNRYLIDLRYFYIKNRQFMRGIPLTTSQVMVNLIEVAKVSRKFNINTFIKIDFIDGYKRIPNR